MLASNLNPSKNPFRPSLTDQTQQSYHDIITSSRKAPPLPPRNPSQALEKARVPLRQVSTTSLSSPSSSSSLNTMDSAALYSPTSRSRPSSLMQQSLRAASDHQRAKRNELVLNVIHSSSVAPRRISKSPQPSSSSSTTHSPSDSSRNDPSMMMSHPKHAQLITSVARALKQVEFNDSKPPPSRRVPLAPKKQSESLRHLLENDPDIQYWSCADLLSGAGKKRPYTLVILNQPITRKDVFIRAWNASEFLDSGPA